MSSELLRSINSTIPKEVSFKTITVEENVITFKGVSKNRQGIGELQYNVKQLDIVENAQVGSISSDDVGNESYTFDLKCTLKDVDVDENK